MDMWWDNPGYWFLHCHIEPHLMDGMAAFIEEYPHAQHRRPPPGMAEGDRFLWSGSPTEFFEDFGESSRAPTCGTDGGGGPDGGGGNGGGGGGGGGGNGAGGNRPGFFHWLVHDRIGHFVFHNVNRKLVLA